MVTAAVVMVEVVVQASEEKHVQEDSPWKCRTIHRRRFCRPIERNRRRLTES